MTIIKNTCIALLGLSSIALAGPQPMPMTAPCTPTPPANPYWLEAAAFYGFAGKNLNSGVGSVGKVDLVGGDLTIGVDLCPRHALDLRVGYGYGSNSSNEHFGSSTLHSKARVNTFNLMPGYRYTRHLDGNWSMFLGANLGVNNEEIKARASLDGIGDKDHNSAWGFAYSAEIGLKYDWSARLYSFAAYQFSGSTAKPSVDIAGLRAESRKQVYHNMRLGMGWRF